MISTHYYAAEHSGMLEAACALSNGLSSFICFVYGHVIAVEVLSGGGSLNSAILSS